MASVVSLPALDGAVMGEDDTSSGATSGTAEIVSVVTEIGATEAAGNAIADFETRGG
jgi:hypothetical protein